MEISPYIINGVGATRSQVQVDFNMEKFAMQETEEARSMIEENWEEATKSNNRTFNQSKFRLASHWFDEETEMVVLNVGITDYKDHLGTNLSQKYRDQFYTGTGDRFGRMSQAIAVGAWVVTTDNKVLLVETAPWKGEQACKVDRPGGHAEPDESLKGLQGGQYRDLTQDLVIEEIFESISKEVRDEVNLGLEVQKAPELLGVITNLERGGRSALEFLIELTISSEEVMSLYKMGGVEADESTNLFFLDLQDIKNNKIDLFSRFTPYSVGSIELLKHRLEFKS